MLVIMFESLRRTRLQLIAVTTSTTVFYILALRFQISKLNVGPTTVRAKNSSPPKTDYHSFYELLDVSKNHPPSQASPRLNSRWSLS